MTDAERDRGTRRARRGWIAVAVIAAVSAGLAAAALLAGEGYAREAARDHVRNLVVTGLALDEGAEVHVDIGGVVLLGALGGVLETVDVSIPRFEVGDLRGAAEIHAERVPFDATMPAEALRVRFRIEESDLGPLTSNLSGLDLASIALEDAEVVIETSFTILGVELPIEMALAPSVEDGALAFTPTTVGVGDESYAASDLREDPILAALAGDLLSTQTLCIAELLPATLVATAAEVRSDALVIFFTADGAALGAPDFVAPGRCPR